MCLIIASKPNADKQPKENLLAAFKTNDHGIGISYVENKCLKTKKWLTSNFDDHLIEFEDFYQFYVNLPKEFPYLLHFRKSSAGTISQENLHPFEVNENLVMAFNGTISFFNYTKADKSDTAFLNDWILKDLAELDQEFIHRYSTSTLLTHFIGSNKMVFLDSEGEFTFFNEFKGEWNSKETEKKNVWFSNDLWKKNMNKIKTSTSSSKTNTEYHNSRSYQIRTNNQNDPLFDQKKKYYRIGDPYYLGLSDSEVEQLKRDNKVRKTKQLKHKGIIARLASLSDNQRREGWIKYKEDFYKDIFENDKSSEIPNPVLPTPLLTDKKEQQQDLMDDDGRGFMKD